MTVAGIQILAPQKGNLREKRQDFRETFAGIQNSTIMEGEIAISVIGGDENRKTTLLEIVTRKERALIPI